MLRIPTTPWAHLPFDVLAWAGGAALGYGLYRWRLRAATERLARTTNGGYFVALILGAAPGAWLA
ncbi:hypothetical protein, partial [Enterococcus faecium]